MFSFVEITKFKNHSMRKIALLTLFLAVACIASAQEQSFDMKKFYLKGGYTLKGKNYLGLNDSKTDPNLAKNYWKEMTLNSYNLDLGSLFYIDMFDLGEKLHVGIDVNYLTLNYTTCDPKIIIPNDYNPANSWAAFVGSAVGPVITYNVTRTIAFDAYFKINPIWISTYNFFNEGVEWDEDYEEDREYLGLSGIKYKFGINAHLDFLLISAEFNPGSVILQNVHYSNEFIGNSGEKTDQFENPSQVENPSKKTPLPVFNFSIGFCF